MEEELMEEEQEVKNPEKKINLDSFFNRVDEVDEKAKSALKQSNSNLSAINANKTLIDSLQLTIEAMKTDIRDIANYIIIEKKIEKDQREDRLLEEQDIRQKKQMSERALSVGQQGPRGDVGPQGTPGEEKQGPKTGGGFLGGLVKLVGGLGLAAGLIALAPLILKGLLIAGGVTLLGFLIGKIAPPIVKFVQGLGPKIGEVFGGLLRNTLGKVPLIGKPVNKFADRISGKLGETSSSIADTLQSNFDNIAGGGGGSGGGGGGGVSAASGGGSNGLSVESGEGGGERDFGDDYKSQEEYFASDEYKDSFKTDPVIESVTGGPEINQSLEMDQKEQKGFLSMLGGLKDRFTGGGENTQSGEDVVKQRAIAGQNKNINIPKNASQVSSAEIKGTGTTVTYVRALSNQYLSIASNKLPPEVARMIQ